MEQEAPPAYRRVLLKISGEMLAGGGESGIRPEIIEAVADEVKAVHEMGVQLAIVIGGGNIFRGIAGASRGMDRTQSDHMGMLATVINALALQDCLERRGCWTRVLSAVTMDQVAEPYIRRRAVRHLEKGRIIILAAGTGNPFFSTDTAAALRAAEIRADIILKGTKVDGIFDKDPVIHADAQMIVETHHMEVIRRNLRVMDLTAFSICLENRIPIVVFNFKRPGNLLKVIRAEKLGTMVRVED